MTQRFGLKESTIKKICDVLVRHLQVEKAVIYGSRAKGDYKNGSDIDLTLHDDKDLTLDILYSIMGEIDDLLLPYTINLSISITSLMRMLSPISNVWVSRFMKK